MKWYDLKCIQWIMQRIPDSNCFQTASLPDSWYSECHLSSSEAVHLGTRRHHSGDSGDGSKRHWMAFFRTIHHMFSAAFSRFQPLSAFEVPLSANFSRFQVQISVSSSGFKWVPEWVLRVSSEVSSEWLGVALQRPLTKASMFPFNFLGKTTFWMPFCTWFRKRLRLRLPPVEPVFWTPVFRVHRWTVKEGTGGALE